MNQEVKAFTGVVSQMMHSKGMREGVQGMLKSGDPQKTVPETAKTLSSKAVEAYKKNRGKAPSTEAIIAGSLVLGTDLIEIGNTGGLFEVSQDQALPLLEATNKAVIKDGLKNKYIDPVELQGLVNDNIGELGTKAGMEAGEAQGVPKEPDVNLAMEQYAQQREQSALQGAEQKMGAHRQEMKQGGQDGI